MQVGQAEVEGIWLYCWELKLSTDDSGKDDE
jgi:hypothetical protein